MQTVPTAIAAMVLSKTLEAIPPAARKTPDAQPLRPILRPAAPTR